MIDETMREYPMKRRHFLAAAGAAALPIPAVAAPIWDVVVYGASAGGVFAAISAARLGARTVMVGGGHDFGGMLTNGLNGADTQLADPTTGQVAMVGGVVLELFTRIGVLYGTGPSAHGAPSEIRAVMQQMCDEAGVHMRLDQEFTALDVVRSRIYGMTLQNGEQLALQGNGAVVDATSTADLLAAVSTHWTVGREPALRYGESLGGFDRIEHTHHVSPYSAGTTLLPNVFPMPDRATGSGDGAVMAYTYRPALSMDRDRVPFSEPDGYNPALYQIYLRSMGTKATSRVGPPYSRYNLYDWDVTDHIGYSWTYPTAGAATRRTITAAHESFIKGWFWFCSHDTAVSASWRDWYRTLGWAPSQFTENRHFPRELYRRSGRRLVGKTVMTQADLQTNITKPDPICVGYHKIDIHPTQILALGPDLVNYEGTGGDAAETAAEIYQIGYDTLLVPDVVNLAMGRCISASHVADASIRMVEPSIGAAAGTAAALAATKQERLSVLGSETSANLAATGAILTDPTQ
jgi:hypothetical protein